MTDQAPNVTQAMTPEVLDALWKRCANLPPACEHEFGGWRDFDDGSGGEQFCQKCGIGAMNWSMWHV